MQVRVSMIIRLFLLVCFFFLSSILFCFLVVFFSVIFRIWEFFHLLDFSLLSMKWIKANCFLLKAVLCV